MSRRIAVVVGGLGLTAALVTAPGWAASKNKPARVAEPTTEAAAQPEPQAAGTRPAIAVAPADDPPYDPLGRRDPFRAPRSGSTPAVGEVRTPLQRYELGQLRLVAVIYETGDPRAVVEDTQGLGYIVKVGTPIGPNGGAVRGIERGKVIVEENAVDFYGESHPSEVTLELRQLRTSERGKK